MTSQVALRADWAWTVQRVMEALPSKPGVNCSTTEKASMLDTASRVGAAGSTGSTPDRSVAVDDAPTPTDVQAATSNV